LSFPQCGFLTSRRLPHSCVAQGRLLMPLNACRLPPRWPQLRESARARERERPPFQQPPCLAAPCFLSPRLVHTLFLMRLFKMNWGSILSVSRSCLAHSRQSHSYCCHSHTGDGDVQPVCAPPCSPGVPQGQAESGGILIAAVCWDASAQRRCYPTGRCTYGPSVTCSLSIKRWLAGQEREREGGWGGGRAEKDRLRETPETSNTLNS